MIRYEFDGKLTFLSICRIIAKLSDRLLPDYSYSEIGDFDENGYCDEYKIVLDSVQEDESTVAKRIILKNDGVSFVGFTPQKACDTYEEILCEIKGESYFKYSGTV